MIHVRADLRTLVPLALKQRFQRFARRPFVKNVAALASGAAASQAIGLIFSPMITRLYGPRAYGIQSILLTVAGVMASVAAMSYPIAIVLPRSDADALGVARLSIVLGIGTSLVTAIVLYWWGDEALALLNAAEVARYRLLIPVFMLASVAGAVVSQWLVRKREFFLTAKISVLLSLLTNAMKAGVGLIQPSAIALIGTNMLGGLAATGLMTAVARRRHAKADHAGKLRDDRAQLSLWSLAQRHRDFPLYRTPQNLLNAISTGLPVALLASYFGSAAAGLYALASAVLVVPASLIGGSVMQVFYPRVTEAIHNGEDAGALVIKATLGLALTGAIPFALVVIAGPALFAFVFGAEWHKAGTYAQWLSPWLFFQYINKPAVSAIPSLGLQGALLVYEIFSTGSKMLALYVGYAAFKSDVAAVALYSVFGVLAYIWLILWVISRCGKLRSKTPEDPSNHDV
jgi:O-antigen/teichoic acid export membrane protein